MIVEKEKRVVVERIVEVDKFVKVPVMQMV
jgi:hypothetical protein